MFSTRSGSTVRRTCAGLAAVLLGLTACSSSKSAAAPGGGGTSQCTAPSTVVFADNHPISVLAVRPVAQGTNAFADLEKKCNTKVKVVEYGNGSDVMNALVGGQADIGDSSATSFAKAEAKGKQMQVVFAAFVGGGAVLIGRKKYEADRGTDVAKYGGATWGYPDATGSCMFISQTVAQHAGLTWTAQKKVVFGSNSAAPVTLSSGRADVLCTDPSTAAAAVASGTAYVVFNCNDAKTAEPVLGALLGGVYGMNKSFVDKYPVLTQMLVDAFVKSLKAIQAVATDPAKVLALFPQQDQGPLAKGWADSWPLVAPAIVANDGTLSDKAVTDSLAFSQKFGILSSADATTARQMFNNSFAQKATQSG